MANIGFQAIQDRVIFRAGETDFTWADVARAGAGWGDWADMVAEVRRRSACERRAKELGVMPGEPDVQAAAQEFRVTHALYKAADTVAWLERWGLTTDAWMAYFRQGLAQKKLGPGFDSDQGEPGVSQDSGDEMAILAFGACSGRLAGLARKLAARAAAFELRPRRAAQTWLRARAIRWNEPRPRSRCSGRRS